MIRRTMTRNVLIIIEVLIWTGWVNGAEVAKMHQMPALTVDQIIQHIQRAGEELTTFQADLVYEVNQPEMSLMLRKGSIAYRRDPNQSHLRVDFQTLKEDDLDEVVCKEVFSFDGIWLTHLNYDAKSITQRQMTPENDPADAFELASQSMPLVGFTDMSELSRHFEISIVELVDSPERIGLLLQVKPDSDYSKEYTQLTFEIDRKMWLPAKVVAIAPVGDIHTISFTEIKLNEPLEDEYFLVKIPSGFSKPEIIPLEK